MAFEKYEMMPMFRPGDRVIVGGEIKAVVERVIFTRGRLEPILLVEWWHDGDLREREVHASDVVPA